MAKKFDFKVIEDKDDSLVLFFKNEEPSFLNIVKSKLLEKEEVKSVSVVKEHPEINNVTFSIKTTSGNPKKILKDTLKEIEDEVDEIEKALKL